MSNNRHPNYPHPTLLIRRVRAQVNIARMAAKARASGVRFRPHFKTHQSVEVGEWFRAEGVEAITVSNLQMARQFADAGWRDITIALPLNPAAAAEYNALAARIDRLGLIVDEVDALRELDRQLSRAVDLWIEIDCGYPRSGVAWDDTPGFTAMAEAARSSQHFQLRGLLSHAGQSYACRSREEILAVYADAQGRLTRTHSALEQAGHRGLEISFGDTPCCSVAADFAGLNEIRPGNFVYYDLMQAAIGSCEIDDIAAAVACPVLSRHPERGELILQGGAVHLSKEVLKTAEGPIYGRICELRPDGWSAPLPGVSLTRLSQEHGVVQGPADWIAQQLPGRCLAVLPVHACLAANLLRKSDNTFLLID